MRGTDPDATVSGAGSNKAAGGSGPRYSDGVNPLVVKGSHGETDTVSV